MNRRWIFFLVLCTLAFPSAAQGREELWSLMSFYAVKGKCAYQIQPQVRFNEQGNPLDQFVGNVGGGYLFSPHWVAWLGMTYATNAQDAANNIQEVRLWEQINWRKDALTKSIDVRARLEQRKALEFSDVANRFRDRVTVRWLPNQYLAIVAYDEIFLNINQVSWVNTKTIDQNRIYAGIEPEFSSPFKFGIGYLFQSIFSTPRQLNHALVISMALNMM